MARGPGVGHQLGQGARLPRWSWHSRVSPGCEGHQFCGLSCQTDCLSGQDLGMFAGDVGATAFLLWLLNQAKLMWFSCGSGLLMFPC